MILRENIIPLLIERLKKEDFIQAAWESGSIAFNRSDEWSDIDLAVVVKDGNSIEVFAIVEEALKKITPIDLKHVIQNPGWEGHEQAFYKLKNTSKFLLIDLSVINESAPDKLLEPEIHGNPLVHFDKTGVTKQYKLDAVSHRNKIEKRITSLKVTSELFGGFTEKELNRENYIDAFSFYYGFTLRPLVELIRINHTPAHYNFFSRYVHSELPSEISERLQSFFYISDPDELKAKNIEAQQWFNEIMAEIDGFTP
ncbi:MAG: hypothetical protein ABI792_01320 [bacterium]